MSQDSWFVVLGSLPAPIEKLAQLFPAFEDDKGSVILREDLEDIPVSVDLGTLDDLPADADLNVPEGSTVLCLNGRRFTHFHLNGLDAVAPRGGFFVYEDDGVEEVHAAQAPESLLAATRAVLEGDSVALAIAIASTPEGDHHRLPFNGIRDLALQSTDARLLNAVAGLLSSFHGDGELLKHLSEAKSQLGDSERKSVDNELRENFEEAANADAYVWADEIDPTPSLAQAVIEKVLQGDRQAMARISAWVERFEEADSGTVAQRGALGRSIVSALSRADQPRRDQLLGWLGAMWFWEEAEQIATLVKDDPRHTTLITVLRQLAATEPARLRENDFSDL